MKKNQLILLILIILGIQVQTTYAKIVAVLEIVSTNENAQLEISEFKYLTDELRKQAAETLGKDYTVLTRDNIFQLIPPDEKEADCLAESCAVEIGRAIGAEYVTQGSLGYFQGMLSLTIELYESMSGRLISSFTAERESARGLLLEIREKSPEMFKKLVQMSEPKTTDLSDVLDTKTVETDNYPSLPAVSDVQTNQKSNSSIWIAIGLDALGAVAIGVGIYQNSQKNKHYNEHKRLSNGVLLPEEQHKANDAYDKAESARKGRDAAIVIGGVLLASGIAVHVWF